jgi:CubicO group peptidase (beta-lactamase class C family)
MMKCAGQHRCGVLRLFLSATIFVVALGAAPAASSPEALTVFQKTFADYVREEHVVGASYLVLDRTGVTDRRFFGMGDSELKQAVDANTIFHWASITKTFTAVAIMQLRDRGKLSLDDPILKYLPELKRVHSEDDWIGKITLRHLLSHSAGFQSATWPYTQGKPWQPFEPTEWSQLVAMMPYQEISFAPGTKFQYSNPGFIYLGKVIELISGDPYEVYIQKNILTPLGMTRTCFNYTPYHLEQYRSNSYAIGMDDQGRESVRAFGREFNTGITTANGGLNAPMDDMAKWISFLAGGSTSLGSQPVLRRSSLEEMWRPVVDVPSDASFGPVEMGLSFFLYPHFAGSAGPMVSHTGHQAGFAMFFVLDPGSGRAIVGATNTIREEGENPGAKKRYEQYDQHWNSLLQAALELVAGDKSGNREKPAATQVPER